MPFLETRDNLRSFKTNQSSVAALMAILWLFEDGFFPKKLTPVKKTERSLRVKTFFKSFFNKSLVLFRFGTYNVLTEDRVNEQRKQKTLKCNGMYYNSANEFCFNNKLYQHRYYALSNGWQRLQ